MTQLDYSVTPLLYLGRTDTFMESWASQGSRKVASQLPSHLMNLMEVLPETGDGMIKA